ncbi:MAG: hypothetical protein RLZZ522_1762 [Verrucomicrobiota bacterium]
MSHLVFHARYCRWFRPLAILCAWCVGLAAAAPVLSRAAYVNPDDALGIWDFNNPAVATQSADLMQGTPLVWQAGAAFSADAGGRSGLAGDRAVNLGTVAGNFALVTDAAFLGLLNLSCQTKDQLTITFWQKWSTPVAASSSVWLTSTSADGGNRGFQAHVPWMDGPIYFDTSGCCTDTTQRLAGGVSGVDWQAWHHVALVKSGGAKQVWINGVLRLSQANGASALPTDFTDLRVGQLGGGSSDTVRGLIDDFAVFGTVLDAAQIGSLAAGAAPIGLVVAPASRPPEIGSLVPAAGTLGYAVTGGIGFTAMVTAPNGIPTGGLRLFVDNAEVTASLSLSGTATNRVAIYPAVLQPNRFYTVRAEATDSGARSTVKEWSFDTADPTFSPTHPLLALPALGTPRGSGSGAALAIDGNAATISETANQPGAFWELELDRTVSASRIYLVAPTGAGYARVLDGVVVRVYDLRDQLIHESTVGSVAAGGTWAVILPPGTAARIVRLELPAGQTNGAGDHRIALAELQVRGDPSPAYGPLDLAATAIATQSTTAGVNTAALAIDADAATLSETTNALDSYWLLTLDRDRPLSRVELVNRADANASRMGGLTLRLLDAQSATLATAAVSNPGPGATWSFNVPPGLANVRFLRIGLENGGLNGQGNRVVSLAGVSVFSGTNYALGRPAYMVRLRDNLPAPALANDGNYATFTETTTQTTDGYWETDLGSARALYCVRAVAFDSGADQVRLSHATVRLFDENHESVFSQHLSGASANFDVALPGPVSARYVRVGFENKERSNPNYEWYLRLREVQAFGRPPEETGITRFSAAASQLSAGQSTTLNWQAEDLRELILYPEGGSVGSYVNAQGTGTMTVAPATSTEYINGTYWGQYNAHERLEDSFLAGYLGGKTEDYVNVRGNDNDGADFVTGTPEPPNRALWEAARANKGAYAVVKSSVDVPQLIDFMLLWFYGECEGEFRCAGPITAGSGFKFWMADADGFLRTSALTLDTTATAGPGGIFGALVAEGHPDFKMLLADRIYKHFYNTGALTPDRNLARLNTRMTEIQDSLIAECARWGYQNPTSWESSAQTIRSGLFPQRTANLLALLKGRGFFPNIDPPVLSKYPTTYFRKTFTVADPSAITSLSLGLVRDDGAVVYLNGVEVARSNMPASGSISYSNYASDAISGDANKLMVHPFSVPANLLVAGANLLAVEVHQANGGSSDLLFDLSLTASLSPRLTLSQNTTVKARLLNGGTWSALADASFQVAHPLLTGGPYVFGQWATTAAAGTYPQAMRLFQTDTLDPELTATMISPWTLPYNLTSRSRITGLGSDGLGFINTGNVQTTPGAGFVGAAVVALHTSGTQSIRVTWTGGTVVPNDRDYGIRLQYRVGEAGTFVDVPAPGGGAVEYLRNPLAGHAQVIGPVTLPVAAENQPLVELRWKYYFRSGTTGSRPELRLDDIQVTAGPVLPEALALVDFPVTAQAGGTSGSVEIEVRGRNGAIAEDFNGLVTVGLAGSSGLLGGTLTRLAASSPAAPNRRGFWRGI